MIDRKKTNMLLTLGGTILENLKRLAISEAEAIDRIISICSEHSIEIEVLDRKKNSRRINVFRDDSTGMIRIFDTNKGLTLDRSAGRDTGLNDFILEKFMEIDTVETVKNKTYSFKHVDIANYNKIKEEIIKFCIDNNSTIENEQTNPGSHIKETYKIVDQESHEVLTILFYTNHTLKVDGLSWNLWEKICYIIEKQIKPDICDIVYRMTLKSDETSNKVVSSQIKETQKIVDSKLNPKVIEFIEIHDYNLIVASELLLQSKVQLPVYNSIIFPFFMASEGFFKKVLVELGIVKSFEMNSRFQFGTCFNPNLTLKTKYIPCLCTTNKDSQLEGLTLLMKQATNRNKFGHSTPGKPNQVVDDLTECQEYCSEVIDVLNESYAKIF